MFFFNNCPCCNRNDRCVRCRCCCRQPERKPDCCKPDCCEMHCCRRAQDACNVQRPCKCECCRCCCRKPENRCNCCNCNNGGYGGYGEDAD